MINILIADDHAIFVEALVSLLTGYGFATAIVGGALFVDRVLYGGPADQRLALGALAGATAVGALVSARRFVAASVSCHSASPVCAPELFR